MKKTISLLVFMLLFTMLKAQFSENFNSATNDSLPSGWTKFKLDGLTPSTSVTGPTSSGGLGEPFDKAWGCYDFSADGFFSSRAAWSTSWFTVAGTANRWMFTPAIVVPASNPVLQYRELTASGDGTYQGYELHIMTTAPTAGTITSSTILLTVASATDTSIRSVDLSAYHGQTVYIGWRDNETNEAILGIDDIVVKALPTISTTLTSVNTADYVLAGNTNITGTVINNGFAPITSFDVAYTTTGTTALTSPVCHLTGLNVASMGTYNFTHTTPAALAMGQDNITVTISNVNGGSDALATDTVLTKAITVTSSTPTKRVFCEEETGTWCGYCVRGIVYMDQTATAHPTDWVGIGVHNSDPMTVTAWDAGTTAFPGFTGFPSVEVDRTILDDPSNLAADYTTQKALVSPVDVALASVAYNSGTGVVSFDVKATPVTTGTVNWRIDGAIYEMGVTWHDDASPTADSANYEQHNYYSYAMYGTSGGPMGGFENLPGIIAAADMHFDYVGRAILGGYAGTSGSIPASIVSGTTYTQTYTYTVPSYYVWTNLTAVGFVVDQASGKVLNCIQSVVSPVGINEVHSNSFKMYPNPSNGIVYLAGLDANSQITVTNIYGKNLMFVQNVNSIDLSNFANGIYFINVKSGNNVSTQKIVLNK